MSLPREGELVTGGTVRIRFPHMELDMSCDNETELEAVMKMLKACLEIHETNAAKAMLIQAALEDEHGVKKQQPGYSGPRPGTDRASITATELQARQKAMEDLLRYSPSVLKDPPSPFGQYTSGNTDAIDALRYATTNTSTIA